jgi:MoaA/NifB/PqqE/SkfB family radical SAM enzyme
MDEKILYWIDRMARIENNQFSSPVCCEIDPSNACPLDCKFCFYKEHLKTNKQHLSMSIYVSLLASLQRLGVKGITFTGGGEPLMAPNFQMMFDLAVASGFEVGLITNGVMLDRVLGVENFKFIRVSLDSATKETYQSVKGRDYFSKVIENIQSVVGKCETVGVAFVVCEENKHEVELADQLAISMGVSYIQFKPAVMANGQVFSDFSPPTNNKSIHTDRWKATDNTPCIVAHLVGVVGADSLVYFCCQHRGNPRMAIGSLENETFEDLWLKRLDFIKQVDPTKCPQCRYMNYARVYADWKAKGVLLMKHLNFL